MSKPNLLVLPIVYFALFATTGVRAQSELQSSEAAQIQGARHLMQQLSCQNSITNVIPLMSDRSAAAVAILYDSFASQMVSSFGTTPEASNQKEAMLKLAADLAGVNRRYGVETTAEPAKEWTEASKHGRAFALAVIGILTKDMSSDERMDLHARLMPPARAYNYVSVAPGRIKISLINGNNFPGLNQSYAEALWEDGSWRLDLGTASWTQ